MYVISQLFLVPINLIVTTDSIIINTVSSLTHTSSKAFKECPTETEIQ